MKKIFFLTLGLLLFYTSVFASASLPTGFNTSISTDLGTIGLGTEQISRLNIFGPNPFYDSYEFKLSDISDVNLSLLSLQFTSFQEITGFAAYIYDATKQVLGTSSGGFVSFDVLGLSADTSYYVGITGQLSSSTKPAFYSGGLTVAPVPLPGAALFLGAGLLGLVGLRRRQM